MNRKIFSILAFLTVLFALPVKAQVQLSDSAKISMLTASEWNGAVYALFGHTALRVSDDSTGVNAVYNYGFFLIRLSLILFTILYLAGQIIYLGLQLLRIFFSSMNTGGGRRWLNRS